MHEQHQRRPAEIGDVGEILQRIERGCRAHGGSDHARRNPRYDEGVAVRLRTCAGLLADEAAGAGAIVDHEGLPEHPPEMVRDDARQDVRGSAGGKRHDDADRL